MAEAFISQLLRAENRVQPTSNDQPCIICLAECGTLCPETGIVEWEIRLPCNHTVGSRCIAKWLDPADVGNNSCPLCRHVFFPAQPQPYFEHGIVTEGNDDLNPADVTGYEYGHTYPEWLDIDAFSQFQIGNGNEEEQHEENAAEEVDEEGELEMQDERIEEHEIAADDIRHHNLADLDTIKTMCETYCHRLDLASSSSRVISLSQHLAQNIHVACMFHFCGPSSMAAVSVFVASHLLGVPRTLFRVSMMSGVDGCDILPLYRLFLFSLIEADLIDDEILAMVGRGDFNTVLGYLPDVSVL